MTDVERLLADTLADDRWALPVPPAAVPRLQHQVRVRRVRRRVAAGAAVAVVGVSAAAVVTAARDGLSTGPAPAPVAGSPVPAPDVVRGVVVDPAGGPLRGIAVLPADSSRVLTRTGADGVFEVPCGPALVLAPYAPAAVGAAVTERSPGAGNVAWRRLATATACGTVLPVRLVPGGAVEGSSVPAGVEEVRLVRLPGAALAPGPQSLVFVTRVRADGSWRVEGLDTGRYRVEHSGRLVDVTAGRAVALG
jgi:hypothetical protein